MPLLILFVVILVVVAGPLAWFLWLFRLRPGATQMMLVGAAAGPEEAKLWDNALRAAGISAHVRNVGDPWPLAGRSSYAYEVWVRERDADRAREVLGF